MIAAPRRMATLDFLLVGFSATVALLAFWPAAGPRQTIELRDAGGHVQQYSFEADDPRLEQLTQAVAEQSRPRPTASLATLKWLAETADYYVSRTEPKKSEGNYVLPVSYRRSPTVSPPTSETDALIAQQSYWIKIREESERKVVEAEAQLKHQQSLAVPPAVVLGDVTRSGHSPSILVASTIMGLGIAGIFALWTYACPPIRLRTDASSPEFQPRESRPTGPRELQMVIPSQWVRVHQPTSVTIRRITQAAVVIAGLVCAIA